MCGCRSDLLWFKESRFNRAGVLVTDWDAEFAKKRAAHTAQQATDEHYQVRRREAANAQAEEVAGILRSVRALAAEYEVEVVGAVGIGSPIILVKKHGRNGPHVAMEVWLEPEMYWIGWSHGSYVEAGDTPLQERDAAISKILDRIARQ